VGKRIVINAAIADWISGFISEPYIIRTKEVTVCENDKDKIIDLLNRCNSFTIEHDCMCFIVDKTQDEIDEQIESHERYKDGMLYRLKKSYSNPKWKTMMEEYLVHKDLEWVLDILKEECNEQEQEDS